MVVGVLKRGRFLALLAGFAIATMLLGASPAVAANSPEWRLTSVSTPTNMWLAANEVQEMKVELKPGESYLVGGFRNKELVGVVEIAAEASAAEVAAKLEGIYGAGTVSVAGSLDAKGNKLYEVTFVGSLAGQAVELMRTSSAIFFSGEEEVEAVNSGVVFTEKTRGGSGELVVTATNVGGAATDGSTVTLSDVLPAGMFASAISGFDAYSHARIHGAVNPASILACAAPPVLSCTYTGGVDAGDTLIVKIGVGLTSASPPASVPDEATVSGGGAASVSSVFQLSIASTPASFGVVPESLIAATSSSQAGSHANVTTAFSMKTRSVNVAVSPLRDVRFDLPRGLVGNTVGIPRCTMATVEKEECPRDTMVGIAIVNILIPGFTHPETVTIPVYDIAPAPGEPAAFAFKPVLPTVRLDTSVLSNGDYGVRVTAPDLSEAASILSTWITIWGVPADHNGPGSNGELSDSRKVFGGESFGGPSGGAGGYSSRVPLLTNPSQCEEPLSATISVDSWTNPGMFVSESTPTGSMTGCGLLGLTSSFSMLPDTLQAGAPAGYKFSLNVPQSNEPDSLVTPDVKRVSLSLPVGTVVSPSAADGLAACSDAQFGLHSGVPGECPRESQVGTVQIFTPALPLPLEGQVYLGSPSCDPCSPADAADGRMVRLFVNVVGKGESGIVVKLEGKGTINQQTGQITTVFDQNPQLPFSELKLILGGGERATLANPRVCGTATTSMDMTPWSAPFTPDSTPTSSFEVTGCPPPQFGPSFTGGSTNIQAGEDTPFTLAFGRSDADQFLSGLQLQMPAGLLGSLSSVVLCGEPQAAQGTCGPESLIGHVNVETGPGADPFLVTGGQIFITGPYKGAPYGLSIVVPAKAGPYTLSGSTGTGLVVVRAAISIDPHTAKLTVTSDALPIMLDGIPLQLRLVNVTIDRPGFTFNPTNCSKLQVAGTVTSTEGASVGVSAPFQVTNCGGLGFKPQFKVSTSGHTSRANGASLDARVIYPLGPKLANIAKVKVDLPKQLPSQLETLKHACPAATFDANPGSCPAASVVGIARANTPILPVGLTGPAYFVSHGGEAFPSLIIVLQGYGVRVDLIGDTFINKAGITSSTFNNVPDVPISSFELYLPEGPHSALAAPGGKLCSSKLVMPTAFTAQNGLTIHQSTPIAVTGCAAKASKAKKARRARKAGNTRRTGHGNGGGGR